MVRDAHADNANVIDTYDDVSEAPKDVERSSMDVGHVRMYSLKQERVSAMRVDQTDFHVHPNR